MKIDPASLKALRAQKGWSRQKLADESKVSARQIARIEALKTSVNVREYTVVRLSRALKVDREILVGNKPLDPIQPVPQTNADIQVGTRISPQVRLAYDLVKHRYGPSQKDLINLAPLLFALLAEGSLAWRRQYVDEVEEAMDRLSAFGEKQSHLYFTYHQANIECGFGAEKESIESADLRGDTLRNRDDANLDFADEILYEVTPFADYLYKFSKDLGISGIVDFGSGVADDPWGTEPYQICRNELNEITGGSKYARWALEHGDVRLSEIPKELMPEQAKGRRIDWLENKLNDKTREIMEEREHFENFLENFIKGDAS